jgi:ATP-dependent Clp protease, protease subunit
MTLDPTARASDGPLDLTDHQGWMRRQMLERRIVSLSGTLDDATANEVAVTLMTLDASGDEAVQLQLDSGEGTVVAALAVMDVIDLLGVPVQGLAIGQVAGPAVGVLAVCHRRRVSPHASLRLFEPPSEMWGNARQLEQLVTAHAAGWSTFCRRVSEATGQEVARITDDASRGRYFTAAEAVEYGLADEIATPDARIYRLPGRTIGFGSR